MRTRAHIAAVTLALVLASGLAFGQVRRVAELNTRQIGGLDRAKTVVLLPSAILEQHGPFLPSFADGYQLDTITERVARSVVTRPGWSALVFPVIPLGSGPANVIGSKWSFPGSYPVRTETVRSIFMDLATELGDQGFKWVLVLTAHAAPHHNRALDQAGDYFRDEFRGQMVNVMGLMSVFTAAPSGASGRLPAEDGFSVHAGARETGQMLAVRPQLVSADRSAAPAIRGDSFADLMRLARAPAWSGYFGSPRAATAAIGQAWLAALTAEAVAVTGRILDGADPRSLPRYADIMKSDPANSEVERASLAREADVTRRQRAWLQKTGTP
jgi:creatinine amidohydrolase